MKINNITLFLLFSFLAVTARSQNIVNVNPNNATEGTNISVSISGQGTQFGQGTSTTQVWFNQGSSTLSAYAVNVSSLTSLTADFNVPYGTPLGLYGTNIYNSVDGHVQLPLSFTINAGNAPPFLISVNPNQGSPGTTIPVTLTGQNTHFTQGTGTITFIQGSNTLNVISTNVVSNTQSDLMLEIPPGASPGYYDVITTTPLDGMMALNWGFLVSGGPCNPYTATIAGNVCPNSPGTITMQGGTPPYQLEIGNQTYTSAFNLFNFSPPDTGAYVIHSITDINGCGATLADSIIYYHAFSATLDAGAACLGEPLHFNSGINSQSPVVNQYIWFGDGTIGFDTVHNYNFPGVYAPQLYVSNQDGCSINVVANGAAVVYPLPGMQVVSVTPSNCGMNNGAFEISGAGNSPFSYQVSGPSGYSSVLPLNINLSPGLYQINITDSNACNSNHTVTVNNLSQLTNITGTVETSGGNPAPNTTVKLLALSDTIGEMGAAYITVTDGSGAYSFSNLAEGDYLALAIPDPAGFPGSMPVYASNLYMWDYGDTLSVSCTTQMQQTFTLGEKWVPSGSATLAGQILSGAWGSIGMPLSDIAVYLWDISGGTAVDYTRSDVNGYYGFSLVEPGDYLLVPDIPGFDRINVYLRSVLSGSAETNLDYYADSTIRTIDTLNPIILSPSDVARPSANLNIFPNPFSEETNIIYELSETSHVLLEWFDLAGRKLEFVDLGMKAAGAYRYSYPCKEESGVYLLKATLGNKTEIRKLMVR